MASSSSTSSLKQSQLKAIERVLNLNVDEDDTTTKKNQWKVLIYDVPCRSIISPLLSVSALRSRGVTLHLLLNSNREPIPDVPAVYFVEPTRTNLGIIAQDLATGLYQRSYLNFVTKLPRSLMEEFAKLVIQSGPEPLHRIVSVYDLYLDYICLEKGLFTLNVPNSYQRYNSPTLTQESIEKEMDNVAYGLFSVIATLGCVPIIRCPRGAAPEMVARKLNKLIAEHPVLSRGNTMNHRPLLVIIDRNADLVTPIQHTSTYQALVDDVLVHSANRVEFKQNVGDAQMPRFIQKKYDLDPDQDDFYSNHKFNPFPEAIEQNGIELQSVTTKEMQIKTKAGGAGGSVPPPTASQEEFNAQNTLDLTKAIDSLPKLLELKKQLEIHTSILQACMTQVASRDIPLFYEVESDLATQKYKNDPAKAKKAVLELVRDPTKGNIMDKIRLLAVFALANTNAPSSELDEISEAILTSMWASKTNSPAGAAAQDINSEKKKLEHSLKAINYLKKLRSITNATSFLQESAPEADMLSNFMARAQTQATGFLAKATERVTKMFGMVHKHHITRVVENLVAYKEEDDTYLYLDPKIQRGEVDVHQLKQMPRVPTKEVIAFVVGGGCYAEYQNLQMGDDVDGGSVRVCYGCTELFNSTSFLSQLSDLG